MKLKILTFTILLLLIFSNFISSANIQNTNNQDYDYYSYDELTILLDQLQHVFPNILSYTSLGKTYEGREIWLVKISDNVTVDEEEPELLFTGGIHGNEKPGFEVVIYSLKAIAENFTLININESFSNRIKTIVNNTELYFIPMVNPDGVEAETNKNRRPNDCAFGDTLFRGVNLNRNFGYKWEDFTNHPFKYTLGTIFQMGRRATVMFPFFDTFFGQGNYRGPYPFSENETKAIRNFVENHSIIAGIDYHTYGRNIGYPWAWTKESPEDESLFISIAKNISEINEYSFFQWSDWYFVNGFFTDWMYGEHKIFHFVIELDPTEVHGPRFKRNFKPVLEVCKTHLLVNLYLAERFIILE